MWCLKKLKQYPNITLKISHLIVCEKLSDVRYLICIGKLWNGSNQAHGIFRDSNMGITKLYLGLKDEEIKEMSICLGFVKVSLWKCQTGKLCDRVKKQSFISFNVG